MVTYPPVLVARITKEEDFMKLKEMAHCHDDWSLAYEKTDLKVWSKTGSDSTIRMIKVWTIFSTIPSVDLFNTLMDSDYRKVWDAHLLFFYDIGYLNYNNEISYYAVSFPPPLRSRDFVLQTSWLTRSTEYFILNHSVCHKDHPPRQGFIRAVSHFTGYVIEGMPHDLQGIIPNWVVAKGTQIFAPRIVKQVEKAAADYPAWKSQNNPNYFPWINPDQIKSAIIPASDCVASDKERQGAFFKSVLESCLLQRDGKRSSSAVREEVTGHSATVREEVTGHSAIVREDVTSSSGTIRENVTGSSGTVREEVMGSSATESNTLVESTPAGTSKLSVHAVTETKRKWKPTLRISRSSKKKSTKKASVKGVREHPLNVLKKKIQNLVNICNSGSELRYRSVKLSLIEES